MTENLIQFPRNQNSFMALVREKLYEAEAKGTRRMDLIPDVPVEERERDPNAPSLQELTCPRCASGDDPDCQAAYENWVSESRRRLEDTRKILAARRPKPKPVVSYLREVSR